MNASIRCIRVVDDKVVMVDILTLENTAIAYDLALHVCRLLGTRCIRCAAMMRRFNEITAAFGACVFLIQIDFVVDVTLQEIAHLLFIYKLDGILAK